jgi:hypothetical protein
MANADGSVVIRVDADDKKAIKKLDDVAKKANDVRKGLDGKSILINTDVSQAEREIDRLRTSIGKLEEDIRVKERLALETQNAKAMARERSKMASDSGDDATAQKMAKEWDRLDAKAKRYAEQINEAQVRLDVEKEAAGNIAQAVLKAAEETGEASRNAEKMNAAVKKAAKSAEAFGKRIKSVVQGALVFTVITQGLSKLRDWMSDVVSTNSAASASIAKLKGALLTMVQPLVQVIIPAFTTLVKVLTAVVSVIANVVSALFGTTAAESANAAKSLNDQKNAYKGVGSAAKSASKQLASFDEINKLSGESSDGSSADIAPDFSFMDSISPRLEQIGKDVALIGAGFALWKIADSLPGALGTIGTKLGGILIAIGGIALAVDGINDAWENGVDWGNMAEIIGGVAAAAFGLSAAFGKVGAGIALVVGGAAMIVTAFKDIIDNGANLKNTLLLIAGIVATGLGFFFLTGSVVPLVIAGIAAVVVAVLALTGNLEEFCKNLKENILGGLIDFIAGVFTGDWERAWDGVKRIFKGVWNGIVVVLESAVNLVIKGINWLISKLNTIQIKIPDWLGGGSFGFNIRPITEVHIPRLAQGAVIPPNREFMAVLGDQKQGTNIEAPADLIRQIVREEMNNASGGEEITIKFTGDLAQLARVLSPEITRQQRNRQRALGV